MESLEEATGTLTSSGGYAPIAPYLFAEENVDVYYLEFDDERSGDFEPLKYVFPNKKVVLGLVTAKSAVLEDKEYIYVEVSVCIFLMLIFAFYFIKII